MAPDLERALKVFCEASEYAARAGLLTEVEWQRRITLDDFTETDLLRECAWVILCSGFREQVVRRVFDHISLCFCDWESTSAILDADPACRTAAMASFRNATKLSAIIRMALHVHARGFTVFKHAVLDPTLLNPCIFLSLRRLADANSPLDCCAIGHARDSKMTGCGGIRSEVICDELVWHEAILFADLGHHRWLWPKSQNGEPPTT